MKEKLYGIIGNPVLHSLSPALHNYWFKKYNLNSSYNLFNIKENEIEKMLDRVRSGEINGLNVTLPYKQKVISYLDQIINDAGETNSVNTIYLNEEGVLVGDNTDVFGIQAAYLKEINDSKDKKALVIGAGGVSPSVIFALIKSKIQNITVVNRTHDKSLFLKKKFKFLNILKWNSLEADLGNFDIIINATSLGLKNGNDFDFEFNGVKDDVIYIDTIYNPIQTKTVKFLNKNKKRTFGGLEMLMHQGQKSFYLWNKINPEINNELIELLISKLK